MAVPKHRTSKQKKRERRANFKLEPLQLIDCSNCGVKKRAHLVCKNCGFYKNKEVIQTKKK